MLCSFALRKNTNVLLLKTGQFRVEISCNNRFVHKNETNLKVFDDRLVFFWASFCFSCEYFLLLMTLISCLFGFWDYFTSQKSRHLDISPQNDESIIKKITRRFIDSEKYLLSAALKFVTLVSVTVQERKVLGVLRSGASDHLQGTF